MMATGGNRYIRIRLEGPLQAWGDVTRDLRRPTMPFPGRSALAGLLGCVLGWDYSDRVLTNRLARALRYGVRADRNDSGVLDQGFARLTDYQTARLSNKDRGLAWGGVERREGDYAEGTTILWKEYLCDASLLVAVRLLEGSPITADEATAALKWPRRTPYLGRRACLPSKPLYEGTVEAASAWEALGGATAETCRAWYDVGEGPDAEALEVFDVRDFVTDRWLGPRTMMAGWLGSPGNGPTG